MVYNSNMENIIIKDIFNDEQIKQIYEIVDSTSEELTTVQTSLGHKAYLVGLGENIREHLEKIVQEKFGKDWILNAYQFARYSTSYGYIPKLYPHYDDAFEDHKLTLDVQIKGTRPWAIVVEGTPYTLKDNEALVFSGTDQIHWREDLKLDNTDYFDMVFCHFSKLNDPRGKITKEWKRKMKQDAEVWIEKIGISDQSIKLEDK